MSVWVECVIVRGASRLRFYAARDGERAHVLMMMFRLYDRPREGRVCFVMALWGGVGRFSGKVA